MAMKDLILILMGEASWLYCPMTASIIATDVDAREAAELMVSA